MVEAPKLVAPFLAAAGVSGVAVLVLARFAPVLRMLDRPGGRKEHSHAVPLVGGLAVFASLLAVSGFMGIPSMSWFLLALAVVIAVGCWDDVAEIRPRPKLAIQVAACALMIWGAGVQLSTVGDLLGWRAIGLSFLAIPLTLFAVVGVVNSINMMDGIDGLAGSVSLVAFAWYALVATHSHLGPQALTAWILCGAIAGFLVFNLRLPWQRHARVFLGDAGSLMLGFALGWYAIDLTQGPGRTFPPIAALWIVVLPLADCVSLMVRRLRAGRSAFVADRGHIHHYLLARGFTASQTLAILVGISLACGAVGYFGWRLGLSEAALFYPFFFGFFAFHAWIQRAWAKLRTEEGVAPTLPRSKDAAARAA